MVERKEVIEFSPVFSVINAKNFFFCFFSIVNGFLNNLNITVLFVVFEVEKQNKAVAQITRKWKKIKNIKKVFYEISF